VIEMSSDDFHSDLARAERRRIIVAFAIAPFMYAAFGLLDFFVFPRFFDVLFRIRLTISCVYALMFFTSMLARSYVTTVAHGAIGILIGGAGVAAMTHVTGGYASPYYTGIMLVLVFGAVLFTWPWWVTAIVWCLVTSHKVVVARIGMRPLDSREPHRAIVLKVRRVGHHSPKNTPSPPRSVSAKQAPQPTGKGRMGLTLQPPRSP
jgi:hypothetical protein